MTFFDRETCLLLAGVLIGTGSTIVTMVNGWPIAASFLMSGGVLLAASIWKAARDARATLEK